MQLLSGITYRSAIPEIHINLIVLTSGGSSFLLVLITFHLKEYIRSLFVWNLLVYYFGVTGSGYFLFRRSFILVGFSGWILILFFFGFLIKLVGLIFLTTFTVVRLHVIIGTTSELYQSYLALVSNTNFFKGGVQAIWVDELWLLLLFATSFVMDDHHAFLVTSHHESLPEVGFGFHRPLKQVHWVNLELLVITLSSSLNTYADAHVGLERYGLIHEYFHWLLQISFRHLNPSWRYWGLFNWLIYKFRFFQHNDIRFFIQINFFENHLLKSFYLSAYFDFNFHNIIWIIWLEIVSAFLFSILFTWNILLVLFWLSLLLLLWLLFIFLLFWFLLFLCWLFLNDFSLSLFIWLLIGVISGNELIVWDVDLSFWVLLILDHITCFEVLLNKVQLDRLDDLHLLHSWTFGVRISRLLVTVGGSFASIVLWLLLRVFSRHRLLLRSILVRWRDVDVLW